jgi:kinetochore protein Nuf2
MASQYSFPLLTNAEILACLAELDIPACEDHLLKPTPDSARAVYEPLVLLLVGITRCV